MGKSDNLHLHKKLQKKNSKMVYIFKFFREL